MSAEPAVNVDANVLYNYFYSTWLPDAVEGCPKLENDQGCRDVIEDTELFVVIGPAVESEFEDGIERRNEMHQDLTKFLAEDENRLEQYDPDQRGIDLNSYGKSKLEGLQDEMYFTSDKRKLTICREIWRTLSATLDTLISEFVDEIKDPTVDCSDAQVAFRRLDIGNDIYVLGDAVAIAVEDGIDTLASYDSDLTEDKHIELINDIIERKVDGVDRLFIVDTSSVSHSELDRIAANGDLA